MAGKAKSEAAAANPWKTDKPWLSVKSPTGPRWRAGRKFDREAIELAKSDLSPEQAEQLAGDASLVVTEIDDPAPATAK